MTLGSSATLRRRFAKGGGDQPLFLESRERIVNAAQQDFASSRSLNLVRDGHAVGFIANPNNCQHHHEFEIAQNRCRCHLFEILE
jgi:hypothetical protein